MRLEPGDKAPDFSLKTADGGEVSLSDFAGKKVVIYFYPAAMTPGCTTQACDFRDSLESLAAQDVAVIGISPDKVEKLAKFVDKEGLNFPLASDPEHTAMTEYGTWGEKKNYGRTVMGVIRSTFIVGEDQKIEEALYNVRAKGHVARVRKLLGIDD